MAFLQSVQASIDNIDLKSRDSKAYSGWHGIQIGNTKIGISNIPLTDFKLELQPVNLSHCIEVAETNVDKFAVASPSAFLHNIATIAFLSSLPANCQGRIEPEKTLGRSFDAIFTTTQPILVEMASGFERMGKLLDELSDKKVSLTAVPFVVISKYRLAAVMQFPEALANVSYLEEHQAYPEVLTSEGAFPLCPFVNDHGFWDRIEPILRTLLKNRFLVDQKEADHDPAVEILRLPQSADNQKWLTRIPWFGLLPAREIEINSNIPWLRPQASTVYSNFTQVPAKEEIKIQLIDGKWDLSLDKSTKPRYEMSSDPQYRIFGVQLRENFSVYWRTHKKLGNDQDGFVKRYGACTLINDKFDYKFTQDQFIEAVVAPHYCGFDSQLEELIKSCMPDIAKDKTTEILRELKTVQPFAELCFLRQIAECILIHKKNTGSKRMIVKHPFFHLAASVSIVGNISSSNPDDGFALARFYFTPSRLPAWWPCHITYGEFGACSQSFIFRKPDLDWFMTAPEKVISLAYSFIEESKLPSRAFKIIARSALSTYISIINRASWGYSKVLKPWKYLLWSVNQGFNPAGAIDKFLSTLNENRQGKENPISAYPEINFLVTILRRRVSSGADVVTRTPIFNFEMHLFSFEYSIMNLCPKALYGRKRHSAAVFKKLVEEQRLYFSSLDQNILLMDDMKEIHAQHCLRCSDAYLTERIDKHLKLVDQIAQRQPRFVYSWLTIAMLRKSIPTFGFSKYAGSIRHKSIDDLLTLKGSYDATEMKNSKAMVSVLRECKEICSKKNLPITYMSALVSILDEIYSHPDAIKLLFGIVHKEQVGDNREISMLSGLLRILQSFTETVAAHYEKQTGIGKLNDADKDRSFFETCTRGTSTKFSANFDRTRWGPNFNTRIFGDMMMTLQSMDYPCTFIPGIINWFSQLKGFVQPELDDTYYRETSQVGAARVLYHPAHMGEGIFHNNSSLYHCLLVRYQQIIFEELCDHCGIERPLSVQFITSDDLNWQLISEMKEILIRNAPFFRQFFKRDSIIYNMASVINALYKLFMGFRSSEFNSSLVDYATRTLYNECIKYSMSPIQSFKGHNYWQDIEDCISRFNSCLNLGASFTQAYMVYILSVELAVRRWSMLSLFYKTGILRILNLHDLICSHPHFNTSYIVDHKDPMSYKIIKQTDAFSAYKFKTYEVFYKFFEEQMQEESQSISLKFTAKKDALRYSPAAHAAPMSRMLMTASFMSQKSIQADRIPSIANALPISIMSFEHVSFRTAVVASSIRTATESVSLLDRSLDPMRQVALYLCSATNHICEIVNDRKSDQPLVITKRGVRSSPPIKVNGPTVFVQNFGSYFPGTPGQIHEQLLSRGAEVYRLNQDLRESVENFFAGDKRKIYVYITDIFDKIKDAFGSSKLNVLGVFQEQNGLRHNLHRGVDVSKRLLTSPPFIPLATIFENPIENIGINPDTLHIDCLCMTKGRSEAVFIRDEQLIKVNLSDIVWKDLGNRYESVAGTYVLSKAIPTGFYNWQLLVPFFSQVVVDKGIPNSDGFLVKVTDYIKVEEERKEAKTEEKKRDLDEMTMDSLNEMLANVEFEVDPVELFAQLQEEEKTIITEEAEPDLVFDFETMMSMIDNPVEQKFMRKTRKILDPIIVSLLIMCMDMYYFREATRRFVQSKRNELWRYSVYHGDQIITGHSELIMSILHGATGPQVLRLYYSHFTKLPYYPGHFRKIDAQSYEIDIFTHKCLREAREALDNQDYGHLSELLLWISTGFRS